MHNTTFSPQKVIQKSPLFPQPPSKTPAKTAKPPLSPGAHFFLKKSCTQPKKLLCLLQPLHHAGQRMLIHRRHRISPYLLDPHAHGLIFNTQPVPSRSLKHIPQPDLLGRNLQFSPTMRTLLLLDQPCFMQQQKGPAYHHSALLQRLCNRCRGMHRIRLTRQHRQHPHAQLKTPTLCHAQKTNTPTPRSNQRIAISTTIFSTAPPCKLLQ